MYQITVQYDADPGQTTWSVKDVTTGAKVAGIGPWKSKKFSKRKKIVKKKNIHFVAGHTYNVFIKDKKRNGFPTGFINIQAKRGGKVIWNRKVDGKFKVQKVVQFIMPTL